MNDERAWAVYKVIKDTMFCKQGDIVYPLKGWDYGLANDDTRHTDIEHISVTYKEDGDYPSVTIPKSALEKLDVS